MPPILNAQGLTKSFGATILFKDIAFTISEGDRVGLIGPNGAGKSTLLMALAGEEPVDSGDIALRRNARVQYVRQESTFASGLTVRQVLEQALTRAHISEDEREGRLQETAGRIGFPDLTAEAATLSGGWRKRLAIAEVIVSRPDVLLLDEPTNHLDLEGIAWLEEMLRTARSAVVMISHDRYFLENAATDIIELNRIYTDGLLRVRGSYSKFLEGRELYLAAQAKTQDSLRNKVRNEIEWLRRGPKARATKAKARIDNAHELIGKLAEIDARTRTAVAGIEFSATERQTFRLVEMKNVAIELGKRTIVRNLDFSIIHGMRIGLVGANGTGKTTILRLIAGELEPSAGTIKRAPVLRTVYFSQMRELDPELTLRRALAPDSDAVVYQDRVIHVASYAAKFLFTSDQINQPVSRLSGGERARVLIARLMLQPADLLLLDEPTNDLDIETLEILEESLLEYKGSLVLVTHDRYMLDRVTDVVLGLDGKGNTERLADYAQYEQWRKEADEPAATDAAKSAPSTAEPAAESRTSGKKKLSYLEAREFAGIEDQVEAAEVRLQAARLTLESPAVATDAAALVAALAEAEEAQALADSLYARWAELTEKSS